MLRIRQITSTALPLDQKIVAQVVDMLKERLPGIPDRELEEIPGKLGEPLKSELYPLLFVADEMNGKLRGFALLSHAYKEKFCLLDYLASSTVGGGGVGAALYAHVREVAKDLKVLGIFFECLPDDPALCSSPEFAKTNAARLRFYERFGARPIIGTEYELPLKPGGLDAPHLVFDALDSTEPLRRAKLKSIVSTILTKKYGTVCSPEYVATVVESIKDDPVQIREPRYTKASLPPSPPKIPRTAESLITLVVNDRHLIHHIKERGYVEAPARVEAILKGIEPTGLFRKVEPRTFPEDVLYTVHDRSFVQYFKSVCAKMAPGESLYPYVFPVRNPSLPPKDGEYAAGYYCIDTFTPINKNAFLAAKRGVDCTLTATQSILHGQHFAYALVRPPGHHAEHRYFGGFCYFCNAAFAAQELAKIGKVAILDVDYHHGNGQQDIFYDREDVLTVSIHADPRIAYPFFTGFESEVGHGSGAGFNVNITLPEKTDGKRYHTALRKALAIIKDFKPEFLIVSLGLDVAKGDPTGSWSLGASDIQENGRLIGALKLPTLVVQEGGYKTVSLPKNARAFFVGLTE